MNSSYTYVPNFADNFHGVLLGLWGARDKAVMSALACLMFGVLVASLLWAVGMPGDLVVFAAVLSAVAWGAFFTAVYGAWLAAALTRRQAAIGPARITVSEEGLERATRSASLRQDWSGISSIDETSRVFLMYGADQPVFAIEKSALRSREELVALRRFLRARKPGSYLPDPQ